MWVLRKGGEFTDGRIRVHGSKTLIFFGLTMVVIAGSFLPLKAGPVGFFAVFVLIVLFRAEFRKWERWFLGRRGESAVTDALKTLPDDYVLLNDLMLPEGRGNLDHFVIGPNGLFAIETKNYSGYVKCDGDDWYVNRKKVHSLSRQAKKNAMAVKSSLASLEIKIPFIVAVLVFTSSRGTLKLYQPTVPVLKVGELPEFILHYNGTSVKKEDRKAIVEHFQSMRPEPDFPSRTTSILAHSRSFRFPL
jgi:hypothetical protein